jgi:hypothetical protein
MLASDRCQLATTIPPQCAGCYLGIDLSLRAIETAAAATDGCTRFLAADAKGSIRMSGSTSSFNEMIYHFECPSEILVHHEPMLNKW